MLLTDSQSNSLKDCLLEAIVNDDDPDPSCRQYRKDLMEVYEMIFQESPL